MDLQAVIAHATRLLVIQGEGYDHRRRRSHVVLHEEHDRATIQRLATRLAATEPDNEIAWTASPVASLIFLDGRRPALLDVGLLSVGWVRLPGPASDARLLDPTLWTWLTSVGVDLDR